MPFRKNTISCLIRIMELMACSNQNRWDKKIVWKKCALISISIFCLNKAYPVAVIYHVGGYTNNK